MNLMSQLGNNPSISHLKATKQILCYMKETIEYSLMLGCQKIKGFDLVS